MQLIVQGNVNSNFAAKLPPIPHCGYDTAGFKLCGDPMPSARDRHHAAARFMRWCNDRDGFDMSEIWAGMTEAVLLVWSLDADLIDITLRSLKVSLSALVIASAVALPLGTWLAIRRFRHRRFVIATLNAFMGLPPVVVGLIVYLLLSRTGPFGVLDLLFTPTAMIIAQVIIITPLIASITHQAMRELWSEYHGLLISLNTTHGQRIATLIWDGRRTLMTAALAGFGRAIGEVGAIMIVGGNIDHVTRVLTTAIALETGKGDFALALGLGVVLIALSLCVNLTIHSLSRTEREGRW